MKSILTGIFLICSTLCFAQSDSIEVRVKVFDDCDSSKTITAAIVAVGETEAVTDINGYCTINVKKVPYWLSVRAIGYHDYRMIVFRSGMIKVPLKIKCQ